MNDGSFSKQLKRALMSYNISNKSLAAELGVTVRTVDRYLSGEVIPAKIKQQKVFDAITKMAGVKNSTVAYSTLRKVLNDDVVELRTDDEILAQELCDEAQDKSHICKEFATLAPSVQKEIAENIDVFMNIDPYEFIILECFALINDNKRKFVIENLQVAQFKYKDVTTKYFTCEKISQYMGMVLKWQDFKQVDVSESELSIYQTVFKEALDKVSSIHVEQLRIVLREIASMTREDWYLLMLVQMMALGDVGTNCVDNMFVGDKVYMLYSYLNKLADEAGE